MQGEDVGGGEERVERGIEARGGCAGVGEGLDEAERRAGLCGDDGGAEEIVSDGGEEFIAGGGVGAVEGGRWRSGLFVPKSLIGMVSPSPSGMASG